MSSSRAPGWMVAFPSSNVWLMAELSSVMSLSAVRTTGSSLHKEKIERLAAKAKRSFGWPGRSGNSSGG